MPAPLRREQREQIIALKRSGYKVTEIERWTGVSRKCIYFWLRRWEESGDISAHHRAVYQRATTAEQDAAIVATHEANPFKPTRETSSEYSIFAQNRENNNIFLGFPILRTETQNFFYIRCGVSMEMDRSSKMILRFLTSFFSKLNSLRERRFQSGKMCPPPPVTSKIRK
ncbi:hypothetical protein ABMA28_004277 [Loxostege sticticalis]|uniref:Insertion element IS150 protein InsJ-like helix-turn-helix domain-containing protein n=1 Tax=Loxostege sticticalis TaxID=481309 RepID=A0ABD0SQN0_LOXSC